MKGLEDKVAVITGAGAGIGKATAIAFAERGVAVVVAEVQESTGLSTVDAIVRSGGRAVFVHTDITDENSIAELPVKAADAFSRVDILINNAATFVMKGIEASREDWGRSLQGNVVAYSLCSKYLLPLLKRNGGAIVNLCSISALIAQPNFVTYSSAKGAIEAMTRCMALDLAPHGIRVNAISPGTVWTESNEAFTMKDMGLDRKGANIHPRMGGAHILNRVADPAEIAEAIVFLASGSASFITGTNLVVDGGYTAL